jgi:competence protein ComEC
MNFFRSPFLYIAGLLVAGIVFGDFFQWTEISAFVITLIFGLSVFLGIILKGEFTKWFLYSGFFLLGLTLLAYQRSSNSILQGDEVNGFGIGSIEEVRNKESEWKQILIRLNRVGEISTKERVLLTTREKLVEGDVLFVRLDLKRIENRNNPGEFDAKAYWKGKNVRYAGFLLEGDFKLVEPGSQNGLSSFFSRVRAHSEGILKEIIPEHAYGLAVAILLGNKGYLSTEVLMGFQGSGAMHVLAVSGLHVGIVMLLLSQFFQRFSRFLSRERALVLTILITFFYAGLTGFSPSVLRAAIMFSVVMLGQLMSRKTNSLNTLGLSALLLMLWNPLVVYDMGFQLSYLAMIGILTLYKPISRLFYIKNKLVLKLWQGTAVGIAAQITTLPLTLYYFNQFANYFWLSNIAVMAFSGLILGIGLSVLILGRIAALAKIGGFALGIFISVFITLIDNVARLPFAVAYGFELHPITVIMLYLLILVILIRPNLTKNLSSLCLIVFIPLITLQVSRYLNSSGRELVVFNSQHPCLALRSGNSMHFFYDEKMKMKQVKRLASDYVRLHPSKVRYIKLKKGRKYSSPRVGNFELNVSYFIQFSLRNKKYQIIRFQNEKVRKGMPIYMPYLPNDEGILLKDGAFRIPL